MDSCSASQFAQECPVTNATKDGTVGVTPIVLPSSEEGFSETIITREKKEGSLQLNFIATTGAKPTYRADIRLTTRTGEIYHASLSDAKLRAASDRMAENPEHIIQVFKQQENFFINASYKSYIVMSLEQPKLVGLQGVVCTMTSFTLAPMYDEDAARINDLKLDITKLQDKLAATSASLQQLTENNEYLARRVGELKHSIEGVETTNRRLEEANARMRGELDQAHKRQKLWDIDDGRRCYDEFS